MTRLLSGLLSLLVEAITLTVVNAGAAVVRLTTPKRRTTRLPETFKLDDNTVVRLQEMMELWKRLNDHDQKYRWN